MRLFAKCAQVSSGAKESNARFCSAACRQLAYRMRNVLR